MQCHLHIIVLTTCVYRKYIKSMRSGLRAQLLKFASKKILVLLSSSIKMNKKLDSGKYSLYHLPTQVFYQYIIVCNFDCYQQISKAAIKNYQIGRRIPHCGFELELLSEQVQRLRHKVVVTGVSSLTTFTIRYPQQHTAGGA